MAEHAAFPGPSRHAAPQASGPSEIEERWSSSAHLSGITEKEAFRIHEFYTLSTSTSLNVKASCSFSHFYIFFPFLELHALFHTVCPLTQCLNTAIPLRQWHSHLQHIFEIPPTSPLPHHFPAAAKLGARDPGNKRPSFPVGSFQDPPATFHVGPGQSSLRES